MFTDAMSQQVTKYSKGTQTVEVVSETDGAPAKASAVQEVKSEAQPVQQQVSTRISLLIEAFRFIYSFDFIK